MYGRRQNGVDVKSRVQKCGYSLEVFEYRYIEWCKKLGLAAEKQKRQPGKPGLTLFTTPPHNPA